MSIMKIMKLINMLKVYEPVTRRSFAGRVRLLLLGGMIGVALSAHGAIVWQDPEPRLICENGDGADLLHGAVKPQDDSSSSTLYFKFTVDPLSDVTVDIVTLYQAGMVLYEKGVARLGVGNGLAAHAYSAYNATGQGLLWSPVKEATGGGEFDLNAQIPGVTEGALDRPRRGILRTILFRVQYVPGEDDQITVWFQPDLAPGKTEFSQRPEQVTHFKANASFDELHLCHRGGGEGWRFSDLTIATSFDDFVVPPVWQRGWVIGLAVWVLLGLIGGSVWLVERRRVQRKLQHLARARELDQERARIAQDLHDDVGAGLTELMLMSESLEQAVAALPDVCQRAEQIRDRASRLVSTMDEIVWAVNPEKDAVPDLVAYLSCFAQQFLEASGIRCRLDVPMSLPDAAMDSQVRHAVFLAVKEALNNAVKHSEATEIRFCVSCSDQELRVEVEDNGRGFDVEHAEGAGNGLRNLSRRLEAVGGWAEVSSVAGKGTVVRLVKRLNPTAANEK